MQEHLPCLYAVKPLLKEFEVFKKIRIDSYEFIIGATSNSSITLSPHIDCRFKRIGRNRWMVEVAGYGGIKVNGNTVTRNLGHIIHEDDIIQFDVLGLFVYKFVLRYDDCEPFRKRIKLDNIQCTDVIQNRTEDSKLLPKNQENHQNADIYIDLLEKTLTELKQVIESELQCCICEELFICATTLNCSHTFCKYCITLWKKKNTNCPLCRAIIRSECRSLVLDTYIDKMVNNLSNETLVKRNQIINDRKI